METNAYYMRDTKNWHRYELENDGKVCGTVYFSRKADIPDKLIVELHVRKPDEQSD
jgi:hypothetical protein